MIDVHVHDGSVSLFAYPAGSAPVAGDVICYDFDVWDKSQWGPGALAHHEAIAGKEFKVLEVRHMVRRIGLPDTKHYVIAVVEEIDKSQP